jgi:hypothetical protein
MMELYVGSQGNLSKIKLTYWNFGLIMSKKSLHDFEPQF